MIKKEKIKLVITGGTIDSMYDGSKDSVVTLKESSLPAFFDLLKLEDSLSITTVCMKDSRALTKADLMKLLRVINSAKEKKIIVTHGTYTMPDTARFLAANLKKSDHTVVLTGAMIPLTGFSPSDAPFNLGYSLASVKTLPPGIYVCMNGRIFTPQEVVKHLSEGRFISIFQQ